MSITLSARPYGLLTDLIDILNDVSVDAQVDQNNFNKMNENLKNLINSNNIENKQELINQEVHNLISKEYTTVFADKDTLIKTLQEHGVQNIQQNGESIYGKLEGLRIDCYREQNTIFESREQTPFTIKITAECTEEEINKLINDINIEYAANTQEESYIKIKERLEEQGLQINEEEILEDDTIVLTVNI